MTKTREADTAAKTLTGCLQRLNETSSKLSEKESSLAKLTSEIDTLKEAVREFEKKAAAAPNVLQKATPAGASQSHKKETEPSTKKEETVKELGNALQDNMQDPDVGQPGDTGP